MRSIKNSFDDSFLETLCEAKWGTKKKRADEFSWDWIIQTVQSFNNNILSSIN
ncbi:hypothetical protein PF005_g16880 [Phytophthora fragariae]|uniref:Uncharacterized protein n=2 Tax=Phytophthora TaxID=4783 RepID=A0A6A3T8V8_9STRA|nr:hypothetical protein PF003_g2200 [Phytophthora fragariae]KAE9040979.1 hypothetical protein PR002_g4691 [Phytophthora rubi]KAE8932042.1 hypothetical protein PF009_g17914 [Phytophthora fragariae]KAE8995069.1 hypothetical protein PF011_g16485 [Phytophthora fragariae]KAE9095989.1 hypothetical protein PF010_g16499 [Phytophthora fragariae]